MGYNYGIEAIIYWTANWREFRSEICGQFGENEVSTITYFFLLTTVSHNPISFHWEIESSDTLR